MFCNGFIFDIADFKYDVIYYVDAETLQSFSVIFLFIAQYLELVVTNLLYS